MPTSFTIENETDDILPKNEFGAIKSAMLGKNYILNIVIVLAARIKKLNTIYRDKECATDILSFPLSEAEGEIYICPEEAKKEAKKFERTYENFLTFLLIHGCAHLKGLDHGSRMESVEAKFRKKFGI